MCIHDFQRCLTEKKGMQQYALTNGKEENMVCQQEIFGFNEQSGQQKRQPNVTPNGFTAFCTAAAIDLVGNTRGSMPTLGTA